MNYFILVFFNLIFASCSARSYTDYAYEMIDSYSKELKTQQGFALSGKGGSLTKDINILFLHFDSSKELNIDQSRQLYVRSVEGLVNKVNTDANIRPYLHNYPFTWRNVDLKISFYKNGQMISDGNIAYISTVNEIVRYVVYDAVKDELITKYKEPYEEAVRIVNATQPPQS